MLPSHGSQCEQVWGCVEEGGGGARGIRGLELIRGAGNEGQDSPVGGGGEGRRGGEGGDYSRL